MTVWENCSIHLQLSRLTNTLGTKEYNVGGAGWNVCYVGGRQFFTDPRIGEFSITFTERDGKGQGEGLTTPILQMKYVGDWMPIPVNDLASDYSSYYDCENSDGIGGNPLAGCGNGPFVCHWG
jgi:hypothetical protein